jgi:hypothetical protein
MLLRRVAFSIALLFSASPALAENILVVVDLKMQTMQVKVDGETKYRWDVSTGRMGFDTPPGRYEPTRMYKTYFSQQYDDAPMPYSIFFHQGYAIHGTTDLANLGQVASHGCVRLDPENAATLFAMVKKAGPENTVIRVRSQSATIATLSEPEAVEADRVADAAVTLEATATDATSDLVIDAVTTSTVEVAIPWMRRDVNS